LTSCPNIFVFCKVVFLTPPLAIRSSSTCLAFKNTSDSGSSALNAAANALIPAAVKKRDLQPAEVAGTNRKLMQAAKRYPTAYPCCRTPDASPRNSTGKFSNAVEAAIPQMPPIPDIGVRKVVNNSNIFKPIPKRDLSARNCAGLISICEP
jgi:hypothetical protein